MRRLPLIIVTALAALAIILTAIPSSAESRESERLYARAYELFQKGDYNGAAELFLKVMEIDEADPDLPASRNGYGRGWLAYSLRMAGRLDEANQYVDDAFFSPMPDRRLTVRSDSLSDAAQMSANEGRHAMASILFRETEEEERKITGDSSVWVANTYQNHTDALIGFEPEEETLRRNALAEAIFRRNGFRPGIAAAVSQRGMYYHYMWYPDKAEPLFRQAAELYMEIKDTADAADVNVFRAECLRQLGRQEEAYPLIVESSDILKAGLQIDSAFYPYARALALRSKIECELGDTASLENSAEALRLLDANGDNVSLFHFYATLTNTFLHMVLNKPGCESLALATVERLHDSDFAASYEYHNLRNEAYGHYIRKEPVAVREEFLNESQRLILKDNPSSPQELSLNTHIIELYSFDTERAAMYTDKVGALIDRTYQFIDSLPWKDYWATRSFYENAYSYDLARDNIARVKVDLERLAEIADTVTSDGGMLRYSVMSRQGHLAGITGDNKASLDILQRTVEGMRQDGLTDNDLFKNTVMTLADLHIQIGDKETARRIADYLIDGSNGKLTEQEVTFRANAFMKKGDPASVIALIEEYRNSPDYRPEDDHEVIESLETMSHATLAAMRADYKGAYEMIRSLKEKSRNALNVLDPSKAELLQLKVIELALQNQLGIHDEAKEEAAKTLEVMKEKEVSNPQVKIQVLVNLANLFYEWGDVENLYSALREASGLATTVVQNNFSFMTSAERANFWNQYEILFNTYLPSATIAYDDPRFVELAYDGALLGKGLLLNSDRAVSRLIEKSGDENLKQIYREVERDGKRLSEMPEGEEADKLQAELRKKERKIMDISRELGDYTRSLTGDWREVRDALRKGETAIEVIRGFIGGYPAYAALLLTPGCDTPQKINLGFEHAIKAVDAESRYTTDQLNDILWKNMEPYIPEGSDIFFSPSGEFFKLAVESFPDSLGRLASERYNIHRVSSTRRLTDRNTHEMVRYGAVFGGLDYKADIATTQTSEKEASVTDGGSVLRAPENLRAGVTPLPGTLREANAIHSSLASHNIRTTLAIKADGSESNFKALSGEGLNLLHIGTHGFIWNDEDVEEFNFLSFLSGGNNSMEDRMLNRSGLFLAGANNTLKGATISGSSDDGILTAAEISRLDFSDLDLVVLSACETGLGEISGEGVFGLQRGFKKAGASSLLMSLWKVDDDATSMLMTAFYDKWLSDPLHDKRKALEDAKQTVRGFRGIIEGRERDFSDPAFWSAFILLDPD